MELIHEESFYKVYVSPVGNYFDDAVRIEYSRSHRPLAETAASYAILAGIVFLTACLIDEQRRSC
jgi:hypothetical protein